MDAIPPAASDAVDEYLETVDEKGYHYFLTNTAKRNDPHRVRDRGAVQD